MANGIELLMTEKIYEFLQQLSSVSKLPSEFLQPLNSYKQCKNEDTEENLTKIFLKDLRKIYSAKGNTGHDSKIYFHELLEGTTIYLPSPKFPPRNPELHARVQRLKVEQQEKEYQQMISNITPRILLNKETSDLSVDVKAVRSQIFAILNFVITVLGSFMFGYKMVEYIMPNPNLPAQILFGIILSSVVGLAEVYFLIKQMDWNDQR